MTDPNSGAGRPAELPALGCGHVAGEERDRLPFCGHCLDLLQADPAAFWQPLREHRGGAGAS
jgi:hypothetical protein